MSIDAVALALVSHAALAFNPPPDAVPFGLLCNTPAVPSGSVACDYNGGSNPFGWSAPAGSSGRLSRRELFDMPSLSPHGPERHYSIPWQYNGGMTFSGWWDNGQAEAQNMTAYINGFTLPAKTGRTGCLS